MDNSIEMPNSEGFFGNYGGSFVPPRLQEIIDEITASYNAIKEDPSFMEELAMLYRDYVGRPSAIFHAKNLSEKIGGADIYLKREDLNHTGAHKINHCLGEALVAKKMAALRKVGVPYSDADISGAAAAVDGKTELDAVIAYLQGLGTNVRPGS